VGGVTATYYTDPFCPVSWAAEGALRRLEWMYGAALEISFVTTGLARQVEPARAQALALASLDAAAASGMPLDARVWLRDPPSSTYPAGIAVHAVAEQSSPGPYLRRLREAILVEGRRMDNADALLDAARGLPPAHALDLERLRVDFASHALLESFGADLERSRAVQAVSPSVRFEGPGGDVWAREAWRWEDWEHAARAAGAEAADAPPGVEAALRRYGSMATIEVAIVCGLPHPRAAAELWRLAMEFAATPRRVPGGELWALTAAG